MTTTIGAAVDRTQWLQRRGAGIGGVQIGIQTYSLRALPRTVDGDAVQPVIDAMLACGITDCELWARQLEPEVAVFGRARPDEPVELQRERENGRQMLRRWRTETPLDHFVQIRRRFNQAGLSIYAYNYGYNDSFTDVEIERGFAMAKALGAQIITASTRLDVAKRVAPFAEKHRMIVALHGHSNVEDPNEVATPSSFDAGLRLSAYFRVNLDIGHFTAANFDAVEFIRARHESITNIHLKDRRRNQGDYTVWGEGDAPIRSVLRLLQREKWPIRVHIEYEYAGTGTPVDEVKRCIAYVRQALA